MGKENLCSFQAHAQTNLGAFQGGAIDNVLETWFNRLRSESLETSGDFSIDKEFSFFDKGRDRKILKQTKGKISRKAERLILII